jgi:hypothetical protein
MISKRLFEESRSTKKVLVARADSHSLMSAHGVFGLYLDLKGGGQVSSMCATASVADTAAARAYRKETIACGRVVIMRCKG